MLSISIQDWEHSWRMGHFLLKNAKSQYVSRYRRISSGSKTETNPNIYYSFIIRYTSLWFGCEIGSFHLISTFYMLCWRLYFFKKQNFFFHPNAIHFFSLTELFLPDYVGLSASGKMSRKYFLLIKQIFLNWWNIKIQIERDKFVQHFPEILLLDKNFKLFQT